MSGVLLFIFVPETFWDRTPVPKVKKPQRPSLLHRISSTLTGHHPQPIPPATSQTPANALQGDCHESEGHYKHKDHHVGFDIPGEEKDHKDNEKDTQKATYNNDDGHHIRFGPVLVADESGEDQAVKQRNSSADLTMTTAADGENTEPKAKCESPSGEDEKSSADGIPQDGSTNGAATGQAASPGTAAERRPSSFARSHSEASDSQSNRDPEKTADSGRPHIPRMPSYMNSVYTHTLRHMPAKSWMQQMQLFHGRLNNDNWFKVLTRPFILFSYPSVVWSSAVYACSVGWLIVISETMAIIYRGEEYQYNFTAMQTGLVYISPFVGGILGTAVAGKVSDMVVKAMSRRNGGLYEPEFRLVMAFPVLITTVAGLMGFGWSAEERDHWMVPTFFFGLISFGCSLGSTTAITFCVDSYRQYAGEALVTLNVTKNIGHGLVFSLFVAHWMEGEGPKEVFMWIGIIQLIVLLFTIPMYLYGKRWRMWTVRKNFMEKF